MREREREEIPKLWFSFGGRNSNFFFVFRRDCFASNSTFWTKDSRSINAFAHTGLRFIFFSSTSENSLINCFNLSNKCGSSSQSKGYIRSHILSTLITLLENKILRRDRKEQEDSLFENFFENDTSFVF